MISLRSLLTFSFLLLLISCSKQESSLSQVLELESREDNNKLPDWVIDDVSEYIYYSSQIANPIIEAGPKDSKKILKLIKNENREIDNIDQYFETVSSTLGIENSIIRNLYNLLEANPEMISLEFFDSNISDRFIQSLTDGFIQLPEVERVNRCTLAQALGAVASGATTLIGCGSCVASWGVTCWGCAWGIGQTYEAMLCFF